MTPFCRCALAGGEFVDDVGVRFERHGRRVAGFGGHAPTLCSSARRREMNEWREP